MNVSAADAALALPRERSGPTSRAGTRSRHGGGTSPRLALRLAAFCGVAAFASLRYATFLVHPPTLRVIGAVVIATCAGGALALSGALATGTAPGQRPAGAASRWTLALLRGTVGLGGLLLALLAIGVPAHLLLPAGWGSLARDLQHGLQGLDGRTWPYLGTERWVRLAVLMLLPLVLMAAACIFFWPSSISRSSLRASSRPLGVRSLTALGLLVAILVARAANESHSAWGAQGIVLVVLIAAWLWLPTIRPAEVNRAGCWLVGCSLLALLVGRALVTPRAWIDFHSASPAAVAATFQWDQLYGPITWPRSPATMFQISEREPSLLRVTSLDRFDGVRFLRSDTPPGSPRLDLADARGESGWYRHATVTIAGLRSSLLVSAGGVPVDVRWLSSGSPQSDTESDGSTVLSSTPTTGTRYEVSSFLPTPTTAELRHAPRAYPRAYLPYAQFELPSPGASGLQRPNLRAEERARPAAAKLVGSLVPGASPASEPAVAGRIESSPYAPMFTLARRLAAGAPSNYAVAERIEHFLLNNYEYAEDVPQERYPLEAFLLQLRRGYCQQFSGAMTLMLRMDGIPARVGAGFKPGAYDATTRSWQVQAIDAHAWVEVFFSGIGWVSFDPTPTHALALPGEAGELDAKAGLLGQSPANGDSEARAPTPVASPAHVSRSGSAVQLLLIGAALLGCSLLLAAGAWWLVGRRRLRDALGGDGSVAVAELRSALARVGYPITPATTLAQLQAELERRHVGAGVGYLLLLRDLRYGSEPSMRPDGRERRELRKALAAGAGPLGTLRALLALPPGAARRI